MLFNIPVPSRACHLPNFPWAEISDIPAGDGNIEKLFYGVIDLGCTALM
jgi:hypothetical protein